MLDVRVYRAAFLPALVALFVVAFSLQGRPSPLRTREVADAFDPARAYGSDARATRCCSSARRSRGGARGRPATPRSPTAWPPSSAPRASRRRGRPHAGSTLDGEAELATVVGVRPGLSSRRIVVLAHRDSLYSPGLADLSGTAALLELARIFRTRAPSAEQDAGEPGRPQLIGRDLRKTLVLVSTSGGSGGGAGALAWASEQDPAADRRGARAGRPRLRGLAEAVGGAVVERARPAAARLAAHGRGRGPPGGRGRPGQRAGQLPVVAQGAAARDHGTGRAQPRRAAGGAVAGQRRARAGTGRATSRASA